MSLLLKWIVIGTCIGFVGHNLGGFDPLYCGLGGALCAAGWDFYQSLRK